MATYVGSTQVGILGGMCATLGVVLPPFIIILLIATILKRLTKNAFIQAFLNGVKPIVIGLITCSGLVLTISVLGFESLQSFNFNIVSLIVLLILASLYSLVRFGFKKKVNTILFILTSAFVGVLISIAFV